MLHLTLLLFPQHIKWCEFRNLAHQFHNGHTRIGENSTGADVPIVRNFGNILLKDAKSIGGNHIKEWMIFGKMIAAHCKKI